MKKGKRTTIYDIARELQITPASVSRALNDNPSISAATRQLVKKTAQKLNYKQNVHASNLRTGGSRTMGVVVPRINNNFFSSVIGGIEDVARRKGYNVIICQSDEDTVREKAAVDTLINQNAACVIISLATTTTNVNHLKDAIRHHIPVIQFDRVDEDLKTMKVLNDNEHAVIDAIKHLAEQGYTKIAHITGPQNINIFRERKQAYEAGLKACKLKGSKSWIMEDCLTVEKAKDATLKLLDSKNPPDAIFAAADLAALGALEAARERNINVPRDLGICGYSNEPYTALTTPTLSTINQNSFQMGRTVANMFFDRDEETSKSLQVVRIDASLIVRQSSSPKRK